ncbi:MAG: acetate kinase [Corynebacterium sp.]|nr:acetate kinase [Corynebacterium sp.]
MAGLVLVLNSGSSSIKFQLVDPTADADAAPVVSGLVEQIGEATGTITMKFGEEVRGESSATLSAVIPDHAVGLDRALEFMSEWGFGPADLDIVAVGHRVVHGGRLFSTPEVITPEIIELIRELIPLAPLHNPANLVGIEVARQILPDVTHVAVFDTGFFHAMPPAAALYAINAEVAAAQDIRRYGFHGTSHQYVSSQVPALMGKDLLDINQITLHLGNGASAAAIKGGRALDTSMGMTPLAGLAMGTRTGDIDPGIVLHLARNGMSIDEIDALLNKQSGVKGIAGVNDFRDIKRLIDEENQDAWLAYNIYIHQLRRYIGSYMIALGDVHAITFTAGVGENSADVRADALANLEMYGIILDPEKNAARVSGPREISAENSKVKVFVVPTNEELAIARYAYELASR